MNFITEGAAFGDSKRGRLLHVDVFTRTYGVDSRDDMPVVGRADDNCVNIFISKEFLVIGICFYAIVRFTGFLRVVFVYEAFGSIEAVAVKVAYGDDAGQVVFPDAGHVVTAGDAAIADGADVDAVTGRKRSA